VLVVIAARSAAAPADNLPDINIEGVEDGNPTIVDLTPTTLPKEAPFLQAVVRTDDKPSRSFQSVVTSSLMEEDAIRAVVGHCFCLSAGSRRA
jgi:hypothetical protein